MGGRGPSSENLTGRAGPLPINFKFDGQGQAAADRTKKLWFGPGRPDAWPAPVGTWQALHHTVVACIGQF